MKFNSSETGLVGKTATERKRKTCMKNFRLKLEWFLINFLLAKKNIFAKFLNVFFSSSSEEFLGRLFSFFKNTYMTTAARSLHILQILSSLNCDVRNFHSFLTQTDRKLFVLKDATRLKSKTLEWSDVIFALFLSFNVFFIFPLSFHNDVGKKEKKMLIEKGEVLSLLIMRFHKN